MNRNLSKLLAIVVLFFFSWTFAGVCSFAYAIDNLPGTVHGHGHGSEERFQKAIEEIGEILEDPSADRETKARKVKTKKSEIEELDNEIKKQFAETEKKLKDAGLPNEILQRHHKFVKHYEDNLNELKANLDSIEKTKGLAVEVEIEKARKHLERVKPPKKHIPLDPNKLPHRTPKVEKREPRLKKEDFEKDFVKPQKAEAQKKPILVASTGSLKGLLSENSEYRIQNSESFTPQSDPLRQAQDRLPIPSLMVAQATAAPTDDDLAENIEVQFTPEIIAKAQELGNNPVKIYNWVRNNIEFVPTYGSIQGAHMTLLTKQGNAFDTASLLIALLRASNIPARYVYGTIELPIDKIMNWVGGFTDPKSAVDLIASGGIPGIALTSGGKVIAVRMEHVWVEAWVDYGPYSGRPSALDPVKSWIPLDSSFKQYTYTDGINLQTAIPFDAQGFLNQLKSTSVINESESYITDVDSNYIQTARNNYQEQLKNYFTQNMPNATAGDILGKREISTQDLGILPANLPYKCIVIGNRWSVLLENLRHKVTLTVNDPYLFEISLSYSATIPELLGKRITLHFVPATSVDEQIIATNAGSETLPAYIINVKPILSIDGVTVANGSSITLGTEQSFLMEFYSPSLGVDMINNSIIAGALYSVGLDPQIISISMVESLKQKVENLQERLNLNPIGITNEEIIGNILYATVSGYFAELDAFNHFLEGIYKVRSIKPTTFAGIASANVQVKYLFGIPTLVRASGSISLDVDRVILALFSRTGEKEIPKQFLTSSGYISSELEAAIHEQLWKPYGIRGISATRVLKLANEAKIPIYLIDKDNLSQVLPNLIVSSEIKSDILSSINADKEIIIPKRSISIGSWTGIGYIVKDKSTGAAAYLISGGLAGGEFVDKLDLLSIWISGFIEKTLRSPFAARLVGILGMLSTHVRNIIKIIDLQNANVLERAVLAIFAGIALIYAAAIFIFGGGELLAILLLSTIISLIASLILELVIREIEISFNRKLKRYQFAYFRDFYKNLKL